MCARYGVTTSAAEFARLIGIKAPGTFGHGYNIPPGQRITAALCLPDGDPEAADARAEQRLAFAQLYWGFIPSWDGRGRGLTNARVEKMDGRYWRKAFRRRRCVVPADWWYEWQGEKGARQPYAFRPVGGEPFFLAGVWSQPKSLPPDHRAAGQRCAAVVTRAATPRLQEVHHRMPVALTPEGARAWLLADDDTPALRQIIAHHGHETIDYWPVSTRVNRPTHGDDASLPEPLAAIDD